MPPQPFRVTKREFGIRPYFGFSSTMAKGQVGEREAELMLKWRKQGPSLDEVMTVTAATKVTVINHTDPERKPRTGQAEMYPLKSIREVGEGLGSATVWASEAPTGHGIGPSVAHGAGSV